MISELLCNDEGDSFEKTTLSKEEIDYLISYEDI